MLRSGATWIGEAFADLEASAVSQFSNVGSATASLRQHDQQWIEVDTFAPLRERRITVRRLDVQHGIYISGCLMDEFPPSQLSNGSYGEILCCRVLERVPYPSTISDRPEQLLTVAGYLVVSISCLFPYLPDPVHTMLRPESVTLVGFFAHPQFVGEEVINCGTRFNHVGRNPLLSSAEAPPELRSFTTAFTAL